MRLIAVLIALFALAACSSGGFDKPEQQQGAPHTSSATSSADSQDTATDNSAAICGDYCDKFVQTHDALKQCITAKQSMCAKELTDAYLAAEEIIDNGDDFPPTSSETMGIVKQNLAKALQTFINTADQYTAADCKDAATNDTTCSLKLQQASLALDQAMLTYTPK